MEICSLKNEVYALRKLDDQITLGHRQGSSDVYKTGECVRSLTSLARSRDALAALTLRSSTLISQALDFVFSHSSLYLICREEFI